MQKGNRRKAIQSHFAKRGLKFGITEANFIRQLEKLLGEERFELWEEVRSARYYGSATVDEEYALYQSVEEMNLVSSSQAEIALEIAVWICSMLDSVLEPNQKLLDLGCSVGNLASFIAESWPEVEVVGFDSGENFIQAAKSKNEISNLSFQVWDYASTAYVDSSHANVLVCSLGIDFESRTVQVDLEGEEIRETDDYKACLKEAKTYFANWRTAINEGGHLLAVLRLSNLTPFVAVADAASDCGWSLNLPASTKLQALGEELPALTFTAVTSEQIPLNDLTAFWLQRNISELFNKRLVDPFAGVLFGLLSDKKELKREEKKYPDGNVARTVVGTAGPLGYRFTNTTLGFEALQIVPASQAKSLAADFDWYRLPEVADETVSAHGKSKKPKRKRR